MAGAWENATDFPSVAYAAQMDRILIHGGASVINNATALKQANPNIKLSLYNFMLGVYLVSGGSGNDPWRSDFLSAMSENWILHNPDGSTNVADRCLRDHSNMICAVDPRVAASNTFWANTAVKLMTSGYSGGPGTAWYTANLIDTLFVDGAFGNSSTTNAGGDWQVPPTITEQANWEGANPYAQSATNTNISTSAAWTVIWYQTVRPALQAHGFDIECNSIFAGRFTSGFWVDDSQAFIPNTVATWDEAYFDTDKSNWGWQLQRLQNSITQKKGWVGIMGGISVGNGIPLATAVPPSLFVAGIAGVLLYTDGANGYLALTDNGFNQTYLTYVQSVQSRIAGPNTADGHNGVVFSPDGSGVLLRRNFLRQGGGSNVIVLLNIDSNGISHTDPGTGVTVPSGGGWIDGQTTF